jgi:hypothetical protein
MKNVMKNKQKEWHTATKPKLVKIKKMRLQFCGKQCSSDSKKARL